MSNITCDLCASQIDRDEGYVFYSDTIQPRSAGMGDIGIMHLCNLCTDTYINDEQFQRHLPMLSMLYADYSELHYGITSEDEVGQRISEDYNKIVAQAEAIGISKADIPSFVDTCDFYFSQNSDAFSKWFHNHNDF